MANPKGKRPGNPSVLRHYSIWHREIWLPALGLVTWVERDVDRGWFWGTEMVLRIFCQKLDIMAMILVESNESWWNCWPTHPKLIQKYWTLLMSQWWLAIPTGQSRKCSLGTTWRLSPCLEDVLPSISLLKVRTPLNSLRSIELCPWSTCPFFFSLDLCGLV